MEKKNELSKVPCGATFTVFGEEFVALDHVDGGIPRVLSIRKNIWKQAPFDRNGKNNLMDASINDELSEYIRILRSRGAVDANLREMVIDLKAADGTSDYGFRTGVRAGLLTLEQYGKYRDIIPLAENWWWLATPLYTRRLRSPDTNSATDAGTVIANGGCGGSYCSCSYGVRPTVCFDSRLLVTVQENSDEKFTEEADRTGGCSGEEKIVVVSEPRDGSIDMVLAVKNWDEQFKSVVQDAITAWNTMEELLDVDFVNFIETRVKNSGYVFETKKFELICE